MGGGRPRTKSNPRSNSGRFVTYVRRQCGFYTVCTTLASTRDRQPLGSSPNHAHATEDNTPCWGESAVATRVLTQWLYLGNYACTLPPTGEQRIRVRRRPRITTRVVATRGCTSHHGVEPSGCTSHHGLPPLFEPSIATRGGVGTTITTRGGVATRGSRYFPPGFEPRPAPVFLPYGY